MQTFTVTVYEKVVGLRTTKYDVVDAKIDVTSFILTLVLQP